MPRGMVSRAIERPEEVEGRDFAVRKHLWYDDVKKQREAFTLSREFRGQDSPERREVGRTRIPAADREELFDEKGPTTARTSKTTTGPAGARPRAVTSCSRSKKRPARASRPARTRARKRSGRVSQIRGQEKLVPRESTAARRHHVPASRSAVEGSPYRSTIQGRNRPARIRPARSARRVQERRFALFRAAPRIEEEASLPWFLKPVIEARQRRARSTCGAAPATRRPRSTQQTAEHEVDLRPKPSLPHPHPPRRRHDSSKSDPARVGGDDVIKKSARRARSAQRPCVRRGKNSEVHGPKTWAATCPRRPRAIINAEKAGLRF